MVKPILLYGSEIWGTSYKSDIENVQNKFCKWLILTGSKTTNVIAKGECGRYDLCATYMCRPIKYFLKLLKMEGNRLPKQCYNMLNERQNGQNNWCTAVKNLLFTTGFGSVWINQGVGNEEMFMLQFKQRLRDINFQTWLSSIENMEKCNFYKSIKSELTCEKYLCCNLPTQQIFAIANMRCSTHRLRIEADRRNNVDRSDRICKICNTGEVETENHFLLRCPVLVDLRRQWIPQCYVTNTSISIFNSDSIHTLKNLSMYIIQALRFREEILSF